MSIINQKRVDNQWTSCAAYPIFRHKGTENQRKDTENQHKGTENQHTLKTNTMALKISELKYHQKKGDVKSAGMKRKNIFSRKSSELS